MNKRIFWLAQAFAAAALVSACGGGGDSPAPAPAPPGPLEAVPPSASESTAGMASYLATLNTLTPEDKEPVDVSSFNPPSPDNTEPDPVS
ncbi:hypothetical protein [Ideonella sp. BN130291]|uniref:hypothetical protein n=1 Tax=Ideonella sp. BN130291 TaxID=3112940 RepID=UPI002E2696BB|nr:hypothetical protein [Ideonella sp. BN130291]